MSITAAVVWFFENPWLIFMVFPLIFGSVAFSCWRDHRKGKKRESMPHTMTDGQYRNFNHKRFSK